MKKLFLTFAVILTYVVTVQGQTRMYYDAVAFDAIDHPEYIITKEGYIVFNKDGSLNKAKSTALAGFSKYEIVRDAKGYPIKIVTDFETTTFKYTDLYMIAEKTIKGEENLTIKYVRESNIKDVNAKTPSEKFSGYYRMSIIEEKFIGTRSRKTSNDYTDPADEYKVVSDSRGNWNEIYRTEDPFGEKKNPVYYDYRIITYHDTKYSYNKSAATNVSLDELLTKPFNLEDGHAILRQPHKYVKKNLKAAGLKFKEWADVYNLESYDRTFLGVPLVSSYKYYTFRSKDSATSYKIDIKGSRWENTWSTEDLFGLIVKELIEQGVVVKPYFKWVNSTTSEFSVAFDYKGYRVSMPNNKGEVTVSYY
jgi:hypothetical protein